jgi:pilus assembly protein CpaD
MSSSRAALIRLLPGLLIAGALGACATDSDGPRRIAEPLTPTEQYPIEVRQNPDEIRLAIHERGLTEGQQAALIALVDRWRETGGGPVTVQAPRGPGDAQAGAYANQAVQALVELGVPLEQVRMAGYQPPAKAGGPPPLIVGFSSYQAVGPQCGNWDNVTATGSNRPYANYGCAVTANFAAQIANPRDLIAPRTMGPPDAARRQTVLDHYRKGEVTSTAKDDQANASTSSSGGGGGGG